MSADELARVLANKIRRHSVNLDINEQGKVLTIGDGVARVYGLEKVQAGELVRFSKGIKGLALNLESSNVGVVVFMR